MREHGELPVEHAARTQPSYGRRHTGATIGVKARLRTIARAHVLHWLLGRTWQLQLLGLGAIAFPRRQNLCGTGFLLQLHRYRLSVAIFYRHAIALRAHSEAGGDDLRAIHLAEEFECLL